jgi:hypothetical protein
MPELHFRCRRAIYLLGVPQAHVEAVPAAWPSSRGKKKRVRLGLSDEHAGWRLVGVGDEAPDAVLYELAWALFGGDDEEDFDLEKLAEELDVPDENIVVVEYVAGAPARCGYALYEANDNFDVLFTGRRDDGKGVRIDVVEGSVKVLKESKRFALPVMEYLRSRGVPEALLPGAGGVSFTPVKQVTIAVTIE